MPEKLDSDSKLILSLLGVVLLVEITLILYGFLSKFIYKWPFAIFLFGIYFSFIIASIFIVMK